MTITFLILAALTIAGMAAAMGLRNLIHCVLALTLGFVGLAALYLNLSRRLGWGLSLLSSFSWSKSIDDASGLYSFSQPSGLNLGELPQIS